MNQKTKMVSHGYSFLIVVLRFPFPLQLFVLSNCPFSYCTKTGVSNLQSTDRIQSAKQFLSGLQSLDIISILAKCWVQGMGGWRRRGVTGWKWVEFCSVQCLVCQTHISSGGDIWIRSTSHFRQSCVIQTCCSRNVADT